MEPFRIANGIDWINHARVTGLPSRHNVKLAGRDPGADAEAAVATLAGKYGTSYDKALASLLKDREALPAFFDVPAEQLGSSHRDHPRRFEEMAPAARDRTLAFRRRRHQVDWRRRRQRRTNARRSIGPRHPDSTIAH